MSRDMPRFLDLPGSNTAAGSWTGKPGVPAGEERRARNDRPALLDPLPDAPEAIDTGWNPDRIATAPRKRGTAVLALAGVAILFAGWLAVSLVASIVESYQASPALGSLAFCIYALGLSLIGAAALGEWRALLALRQVDDLRAGLAQPSGSLVDIKRSMIAWLATVPADVYPTDTVITAVRGAETHEQMAALIRDSLAEPLRQEIGRVARRSAVTGGVLVALSPHTSWDAMIIAVWSLRIIRRVAELHGLRPGPLVTLMLFRRIARTAVEIAAVDLVAQNVAAKLLEHNRLYNLAMWKTVHRLVRPGPDVGRRRRLAAERGRQPPHAPCRFRPGAPACG
jgi:putative membrane protein